MPSITQHQSANSTKLLLIGNSGAGKTGALCSLAAAGWNVRMLDYDNGADIVRALLMDPKSPYPKEAASRFDYIKMTEPRKNVGGKLVPLRAEAWTKTASMLESWKDGDKDLGSITTWGPKDVLVFDSLTTLSKAALRYILQMNGRLGQQPWESDWGQGQDLIRSLFETVTDSSIQCNVIFVCHYKYIDVQGVTKAYPLTLGKALPPEVGVYFNNALLVERTGIGSASKRKIITNPTGVIELKNASPFNVKPEYLIENGLAEYFRDVQGAAPTATTPQPTPTAATAAPPTPLATALAAAGVK